VRGALDEAAAQHRPDGGGDPFLLTLAAPAGEDVYTLFPLAAMAGVIDFFNLMAYDFSTAGVAGHHANLYPSTDTPEATPRYSADRAVQYYLQAGVPARQLVLGVPAYGRSFEQTDGLGTPFAYPPTRGSYVPGWWDYKDLPAEARRAEPGPVRARSGVRRAVDSGGSEARSGEGREGGQGDGGSGDEGDDGHVQVFRDDAAVAVWSYDARTRTLISYDDADTVCAKVAYVRAQGLRGTMFWEAASDRVGEGSLVCVSAEALGISH
jgi:chitinase